MRVHARACWRRMSVPSPLPHSDYPIHVIRVRLSESGYPFASLFGLSESGCSFESRYPSHVIRVRISESGFPSPIIRVSLSVYVRLSESDSPSQPLAAGRPRGIGRAPVRVAVGPVAAVPRPAPPAHPLPPPPPHPPHTHTHTHARAHTQTHTNTNTNTRALWADSPRCPTSRSARPSPARTPAHTHTTHNQRRTPGTPSEIAASVPGRPPPNC